VQGATLCADCTTTLDRAIADLAAHWTDLDNVRAKLTRYGGQGGARGDHLPMDPRFARYVWVPVKDPDTDEILEWQCWIPDGTALVDAVRNTITTWVRVVMDRWPVVTGPACALSCLHATCSVILRSRPPADTIPSCCNYLLRYVDRIRVADFGPEILDEITHLELQLRALVDRPADRWYAGACDGCRRDLYGKTGALEVTCRECDLTYDVAERRCWLLKKARDQLVNSADLSRAVSWFYGKPLSQDRIRQWAHRGRIEPRPAGQHGPLYRVGDALDLLATESQKVG
jgi:hypothetical protein